MTRFQRIGAVFTLAVALSGCTSPVYTAKENFTADKGLSDDRMSRAIVTALIERRWTVQSARPGMIKAAITVRDRHHAEIDIPYTSTSFEMDYRDSRGLDYKDGRIHGTYNRWINYLRDDVVKQLASDPDADQVFASRGAYEPTYQDFQEGVKRATEVGLLDGSVKFYLAGEALPTQVHKLNAVSSSRRADDNEEKSAEDACYWALQSTLATLQSKAKKAGANAVINIAGINKRNLSQDTGKYQCSDDEEIPGLEALKAVVTGVALRGDLVRVD